MTDDQRKIATVVVIAVIGFVGLLINQLFWANLDSKRMAYKNTDAGMLELQIQKLETEARLEAERRKTISRQTRNRPAEMTPQSAHPQRTSVPAAPGGCKSAIGEPNFFAPVKLSQGECLAGNMDFVWVHFDAPPKEISGVVKLGIGVDMTDTATGNKRVKLGQVCQGDAKECIRAWSGQTLFILRDPGQPLIIRS